MTFLELIKAYTRIMHHISSVTNVIPITFVGLITIHYHDIYTPLCVYALQSHWCFHLHRGLLVNVNYENNQNIE